MTTECKQCTVPTDSGDGVCNFCADYTPPLPPVPADAVEIEDWRNLDGNDDEQLPPFRMFTARSWTVEATHDTAMGWELGTADITATIQGVQFGHGGVKRWVTITGSADLLPSEALQHLADALLAARNEIVRMSAADTFAPVFSDTESAR